MIITIIGIASWFLFGFLAYLLMVYALNKEIIVQDILESVIVGIIGPCILVAVLVIWLNYNSSPSWTRRVIYRKRQ